MCEQNNRSKRRRRKTRRLCILCESRISVQQRSFHPTFDLCRLDTLSQFVPDLCILSGLTKNISLPLHHHRTFPSQTREWNGKEGSEVGEKYVIPWRVIEYWSRVFVAEYVHWTSFFLQPPADYWRKGREMPTGLWLPTGLQPDCLHGLRTSLRYVLVHPLSFF